MSQYKKETIEIRILKTAKKHSLNKDILKQAREAYQIEPKLHSAIVNYYSDQLFWYGGMEILNNTKQISI